MDTSIYDNYIFQIVAEGSLTRAAEALGISQPALSLGLNKLENKLGFKIFNRKRKIKYRLSSSAELCHT